MLHSASNGGEYSALFDVSFRLYDGSFRVCFTIS